MRPTLIERLRWWWRFQVFCWTTPTIDSYATREEWREAMRQHLANGPKPPPWVRR